jgi:hypothetical protein
MKGEKARETQLILYPDEYHDLGRSSHKDRMEQYLIG